MHKKIPNIFTFISHFKKEEILNLNKDIGIILRNYKDKFNKNEIIELKRFCKLNKRKLFLANNIKLAINLNLDGVYIPSFNKNLCIKKYNFRKNFLILGSAHNIIEIKVKEKQGVEVLFLSPLFKTKNYKRGLEVIKFNLLSQFSDKKIIALGGINKKNINKLKITNAHGYSGISYFSEKL
jgi:thiamine-phosphate pyrophosphorylase|tara:strand:- start:633 stop:1175 length:543 start_codon:yes stop_codon:yes gene_type:complete